MLDSCECKHPPLVNDVIQGIWLLFQQHHYKTDPKTGKEIPTNRITTAKIIFQGSRERMHELAFGEQKVNPEHGANNSHITRCKDIEEWAKDIYRFVSNQWGEDNILGFYVHLDELNPHIHCTVLPLATIRKKPNVSFNRAFWNLRNNRRC